MKYHEAITAVTASFYSLISLFSRLLHYKCTQKRVFKNFLFFKEMISLQNSIQDWVPGTGSRKVLGIMPTRQ